MKPLEETIARIRKIKWFSASGIPHEQYIVLTSIYEAYDTYGAKMLATWNSQIDALEADAMKQLSNEEIDEIFEVISNEMEPCLWSNYCEFIERCCLEEESGLEHELFDCLKRDASWAAIELLLNKEGFFCQLLTIYEMGHWPCSYEGVYPYGKFVVM